MMSATREVSPSAPGGVPHPTQLLFVVGMPRSGTKLLRDLLSQHPDIAIFPNETHFFPGFYRKFAEYGDVSQRPGFHKLYSEFQETPFCQRMAAKGIVFEETEWFDRLEGNSFRDVLVALFECYRQRTGCSIVGDKTPDYITQIPLLSKLFPTAKFIHIARDPRDYALSMQKAWGKDMLRSVQRWKDQIRSYQKHVARCAISHHDLTYENLIASPQRELTQLCAFLGVEFSEKMLSLDSPPENLGDARGMTTIAGNNSGKWQTRMSRREIEGVESVAGVLMQQLGYTVASRAGDQDLSSTRLAFGRLKDGFNLLKFRVRDEGGLLPALSLSYRAAKHSGVDE